MSSSLVSELADKGMYRLDYYGLICLHSFIFILMTKFSNMIKVFNICFLQIEDNKKGRGGGEVFHRISANLSFNYCVIKDNLLAINIYILIFPH